jgi:hypothetical protein
MRWGAMGQHQSADLPHRHCELGPRALERDHGQLNTLLLHAPDGPLQLRNLLPVFQYSRGKHSNIPVLPVVT